MAMTDEQILTHCNPHNYSAEDIFLMLATIGAACSVIDKYAEVNNAVTQINRSKFDSTVKAAHVREAYKKFETEQHVRDLMTWKDSLDEILKLRDRVKEAVK